jgi:allophanate hydrolase subunit 1
LVATDRWASDHALLVTLGERVGAAAHRPVMGALDALHAAAIPGVRNLHPAYVSILVVFDPRAAEPREVEAAVRRAVDGAALRAGGAARTIDLPVCYQPPYVVPTIYSSGTT